MGTTFSSTYAQLLRPSCATDCHHTRTTQATTFYLDDQQVAYDNLLGKSGPPTESKTLPWVTPGDRTKSFVYLKTIGDPSAGPRMPLGEAKSPQDLIDLLGSWIDEGAKND
jgi:hypothetical protein